MTLPLYKELQKVRLPAEQGDTVNNGLLFERFFDRYDQQCQTVTDQKQAWLNKFHDKVVGNQVALNRYARQQIRMVQHLDGMVGVFSTSYRLVTGVGYPHPVENGLCWHPVWGTPYLAGASVKGLVRTWLEVWDPDSDINSPILERWFGSAVKSTSDADAETRAGEFIFFDAIPTMPVRLVTDIMTPHMGKWYEKGDQITDIETQPDRIPADWHDPVPIPFLAVKDASYLFSVAPRNASLCNLDDIERIFTYLQLALEWLGAGAKTATGYGQMLPDPNNALTMEILPVEQQVINTIDAWPESSIAKKLGKDFNRTKKEICGMFGEDGWSITVKHLWETKSELIRNWKAKEKNTIQKKAFKKLQAAYKLSSIS